MLLLHGWRRVAGEPVASRIEVRRIVGGTLEIEAEARWAASLGPVLGSLVGRLAGQVPELGIRRYRVMGGDGSSTTEAIPVTPDASGVTENIPTKRTPRPAPEEPGAEAPLEDRLERAARRYLERSGRSSR